ncbi:hypothetical protein Bpfe_012039, partial [Biomphalaria pfeifferi]
IFFPFEPSDGRDGTDGENDLSDKVAAVFKELMFTYLRLISSSCAIVVAGVSVHN